MTQTYDIILRNGMIYDGSGGDPYKGDVAIQGDTIAAVGDLGDANAAQEIDVTGLAVAPGFIETDMTSKLPAEIKAKILESIPLRRMGTAGDVAAAVRFLASDEAAYITGHVLAVNGGMYM